MSIWDEILHTDAHNVENKIIPENGSRTRNIVIPCPKCGHAGLEYDQLLNLRCPNCGYKSGGAFT